MNIKVGITTIVQVFWVLDLGQRGLAVRTWLLLDIEAKPATICIPFQKSIFANTGEHGGHTAIQLVGELQDLQPLRSQCLDGLFKIFCLHIFRISNVCKEYLSSPG